jgi:hypothetical protein
MGYGIQVEEQPEFDFANEVVLDLVTVDRPEQITRRLIDAFVQLYLESISGISLCDEDVFPDIRKSSRLEFQPSGRVKGYKRHSDKPTCEFSSVGVINENHMTPFFAASSHGSTANLVKAISRGIPLLDNHYNASSRGFIFGNYVGRKRDFISVNDCIPLQLLNAAKNYGARISFVDIKFAAHRLKDLEEEVRNTYFPKP